MTEDRFRGIQDEFDEDEGFNYNRPILKNARVEDRLTLPYDRFLLFKVTQNS